MWDVREVVKDERVEDARLKQGLRPSPVTRDLEWGVPVPVEGEDVDGMRGKVLCTY